MNVRFLPIHREIYAASCGYHGIFAQHIPEYIAAHNMARKGLKKTHLHPKGLSSNFRVCATFFTDGMRKIFGNTGKQH